MYSHHEKLMSYIFKININHWISLHQKITKKKPTLNTLSNNKLLNNYLLVCSVFLKVRYAN